MNGDEREILEIAGVFHFTFTLVPIQWHDSQPTPVQAARDEHYDVIQTWWQNHQPAISIRDYCDDCFVRSDGSPWEFTLLESVWADENQHRVELWEKEYNVVGHLEIRIDARYPFVDFLAQVVKFANQAKCLFYVSDEDVFVEATSSVIFETFNRSSAASLATNQKQVLKIH